jgi:hypothetical protein
MSLRSDLIVDEMKCSCLGLLKGIFKCGFLNSTPWPLPAKVFQVHKKAGLDARQRVVHHNPVEMRRGWSSENCSINCCNGPPLHSFHFIRPLTTSEVVNTDVRASSLLSHYYPVPRPRPGNQSGPWIPVTLRWLELPEVAVAGVRCRVYGLHLPFPWQILCGGLSRGWASRKCVRRWRWTGVSCGSWGHDHHLLGEDPRVD